MSVALARRSGVTQDHGKHSLKPKQLACVDGHHVQAAYVCMRMGRRTFRAPNDYTQVIQRKNTNRSALDASLSSRRSTSFRIGIVIPTSKLACKGGWNAANDVLLPPIPQDCYGNTSKYLGSGLVRLQLAEQHAAVTMHRCEPSRGSVLSPRAHARSSSPSGIGFGWLFVFRGGERCFVMYVAHVLFSSDHRAQPSRRGRRATWPLRLGNTSCPLLLYAYREKQYAMIAVYNAIS